MSDDRVLVVGGTGFIGSHLAERLAGAGRRVRVASLHGRWPWGELPSGIETVALDLTRSENDAERERALDGVSAVVNLAGRLARPGVAPKDYGALHHAGTARLAAAATAAAGANAPVARTDDTAATPVSLARSAVRTAAGIGGQGATVRETRDAPGQGDPPSRRRLRLVHVSTTGVLGPTGKTPRDESSPPAPLTDYEKSKLEGERAAIAARSAGLEVVVVRPGLVYGPRDLHLLGLYRAIAKGTYRTIARGEALWQPVYVEDVARAIHAALDAPGADGGIFHVAGAERVTVAGLAERIAARLGTRVRPPGLSYAAAMVLGAILEVACTPIGVEAPLTRARVRTMTEDRLYAIDRAREQLGFEPRVGLEEGIGRTIDWYRSHGYL